MRSSLSCLSAVWAPASVYKRLVCIWQRMQSLRRKHWRRELKIQRMRVISKGRNEELQDEGRRHNEQHATAETSLSSSRISDMWPIIFKILERWWRYLTTLCFFSAAVESICGAFLLQGLHDNNNDAHHLTGSESGTVDVRRWMTAMEKGNTPGSLWSDLSSEAELFWCVHKEKFLKKAGKPRQYH